MAHWVQYSVSAPRALVPAAGVVRCEVLERFKDGLGRELVRIGTERPDGVESLEGLTEFVVPAAGWVGVRKCRGLNYLELGRVI